MASKPEPAIKTSTDDSPKPSITAIKKATCILSPLIRSILV